MGEALRVAVVGGGWAGLAAAVHAVQTGHQVSLFEMAAQLGGRARSVHTTGSDQQQDLTLDNGQHILIGAYRHCLALMRTVGTHPDTVLQRRPLTLRYPDSPGLTLPPGPPLMAFARAVLTHPDWTLAERLNLLRHCSAWALAGFQCDPGLSVSQLAAPLRPRLRSDLIEPLCVAALNTPAPQASARVFLRVLKDALFDGPGSSDLLLPKRPLSELLATPAGAWLTRQGAALHLSHRVMSLEAQASSWQLDGQTFDAVVLACTAAEAARLVQGTQPDWAAQARALRYEPIVTVYLHSPGSRLPAPMMALHEGPDAPAQFVFDLGQLQGAGTEAEGRFALVISGAARCLEQGLEAASAACLKQAQVALQAHWRSPPALLKALTEKRATFACTPGLHRPVAAIAPGLWAAGDYVDGPYPATLEGAVMSGQAATQALGPTPQ